MSLATHWERPGGEQTDTVVHFVKALERCGACIVLEGQADGYVSVVNLPDAWHLPDIGTPTDELVFGPDLALELQVLKSRVMEVGESAELETLVGDERQFRFVVEQIAVAGGAGMMTTIVEITEERQREQALRDLLREVNHRSKNLLAIIQSIAAQTARHSESIDEFVQKFRGRLYSLSLSQDLITDSLWRGASFGDLVRSQISRYLPETMDSVEIVGSQVVFPPNAALHLGLALHELTLNAATHGNGVASQPQISVTCARLRKAGQPLVSFSWQEKRRSPTPAPERQDDAEEPHFGRMVLERVLPASVSGTAHYQSTDDGVSYVLEFPEDAINE